MSMRKTFTDLPGEVKRNGQSLRKSKKCAFGIYRDERIMLTDIDNVKRLWVACEEIVKNVWSRKFANLKAMTTFLY